MKFYCLHEGFYEGVEMRLQCLKSAANKYNIDFICINSLTYDYSSRLDLENRYLLYNAARDGQTLESLLLTDNATTFYINNPSLNQTISSTDWSIIYEKEKLPAPKTIFHITDNRELLRKYVEYLEGFPIIIKVTGGTRGVGTLKIESWQSLISTIDYLITTNGKFILRQFINNSGTARLIVLGDKVIASVFRENQFEDFRVSSGEKPIVDYPKEYGEEIYNLAIQATHLANLDTAGVDIVFDKEQNPYLLEINFPHNFVRPQQITDINIAEKMLIHLIEKSKK